jgi:cytoskeleton protein RodZ
VDNEDPQRAPFDQRAALAELERLGQDIARYRARREAFGEEFDSSLKSFKTPPERTADRVTMPASPLEVASVPAPSAAEPADPAASAPLPASTDSPSPAAVPPEALRAPAARARVSLPAPALLGGALVVLLAGGLLIRSLWKPAPESPPSSGGSGAPVAAPAPAAAPLPAAAAAAPSSESAITTVRRVWMRVIVDGERVLEREVPAGTRVPLNAEKTIVIRTGDAGAVRLAIRGEERGSLGVEGEVVTRSFAVPPRRAPAGR